MTAPLAAPASRPARVEELQARIRGMQATRLDSKAVPTHPALESVLPGGTLREGTVVQVEGSTTLLMALHWAFTQLAARWPAVSRLVEGKPVQLAADGELIRGALHRHAISASALEQAIRTAGLEAIGDARAVVLEPSGKISVVKR